MVIIECKDGELDVGDWVLNNILTRDFLAYSRMWIANHTTDEVRKEILALANK